MLRDKFIEAYYKSINWPKWLNTLKIGAFYRRFLTALCNILLYIYPVSGRHEKKILTNASNSEVIISLTSFPKRINTVWKTIESLLQQTMKPKSVILWLSMDQFSSIETLPARLKKLQERGLQIELVEGDLKSHKKYYYVFSRYANNPVLLVDDDLIYHSKMLEQLYHNFTNDKVHFSYGYKIGRNHTGKVNSYNNWEKLWGSVSEDDLFFGSGGGTLLFPSSLYRDCLNKELFMSLCPQADDVWLNAMARIPNLKFSKVRKSNFIPVVINDNETLYSTNISDSQNDTQIENVNEYYNGIIHKKVF